MQRILFFSVLGLFLCTTSVSIGQSPQRIEAMRMIQLGDNQIQTGFFQDALGSFNSAILTDNSYADAYMKRSSLLQRLGQTTEARKDYETAMRLNPYSAMHLDESAKLNFMLEKYGDGMESLEHAIAMEPNNAELRDHRVDGYILTGEYRSAKNDLEKLKETGYIEELISLKQALIYFLEKDYVEAENSLDNVLNLNPQNALAHDVLGLIQLDKADYISAKTSFKKAIEINPKFALAMYNMGVVYRLNNSTDSALYWFNKAVNTHLNTAPVYFARGLLKKDMSNYQGAIDDYSDVNRKDSIYFDAIYNRAFAYQMVGDFENALRDANQAIELNPQDAHAWKLRGNIHMLFGDYGEAIIDYTQCLQQDNQISEAFFSRGLCKILSYRLKDGCDDLRTSYQMGYEMAAEPLGNFCGP